MTRQERLQVELVGGLLKKEGIDYYIDQGGRKHATLVAAGRRFTLLGSPGTDDKSMRRVCQGRAKRFIQAIRGESVQFAPRREAR